MTNVKTLDIRDLCQAYGEKKVFQNITTTLSPGKIYGLLGRNAVGKTTFLNTVAQVIPPQKGDVLYDGVSVAENDAALAHLAFPQVRSATLSLTRLLMLAELAYPNWDSAYAGQLMERFELCSYQTFSALSLGQSTLFRNLLALASRADFTFLDEPTDGLDAVSRKLFYDLLLDDYASTGRTFLLSTHLIQEAAPLLERVLILKDGALIEDTDTAELLEQFRCISGLADVVDELTAGLEVISEEQLYRRKSVVVRDRNAVLDQIESDAVDIFIPELQDVFLALCGPEN